MGTNMDIVATVVAVLNIIFLAFNTFMTLNIKLAVANLRAEIERNRREDSDEVRRWVEERLQQHTKRGYPHENKAI